MIRAKLPILLPKSVERFPIHPVGQSKISANGIDTRYPEAFRVPGHLRSSGPRENGLGSLALKQTRAHVVTQERPGSTGRWTRNQEPSLVVTPPALGCLLNWLILETID